MAAILTQPVQNALNKLPPPTPEPTPKEAPKVADVVLSEESDDTPVFWGEEVSLEGLEKLPEGQTFYKGIKPLKDYVNYLPAEVKKQLYNMQADYTRKTQEIAELRNQLQKERDTLASNHAFINKAYQDITSKMVAEPVTEDELWTPEGLEKLTEQKALKAYQDTFRPFYESLQAETAKREQDKIHEQAKAFVSSKPEFKDPDFKSKVVELVKNGLQLEHAYAITKVALEEERAQAEAGLANKIGESNKRSEQKRLLGRTSSSSKAQPLPELNLKGMSAVSRMNAIEAYKKQHGAMPPNLSKK